jgi:hypothetical protein
MSVTRPRPWRKRRQTDWRTTEGGGGGGGGRLEPEPEGPAEPEGGRLDLVVGTMGGCEEEEVKGSEDMFQITRNCVENIPLQTRCQRWEEASASRVLGRGQARLSLAQQHGGSQGLSAIRRGQLMYANLQSLSFIT